MKPKKKLTKLEIAITTVSSLITNINNQINNSKLKHKIIKTYNSILSIDKNCEQYNDLFLEQNKSALVDYKDDLKKLGIYDNLIKCVLELSLIMKKQYTSFLTKTIDADIIFNTIVSNIYESLKLEHLFFTDCELLDTINNKNIESDNYKLLIQTQKSFFTVINFIEKEILNIPITLVEIEKIIELIKINIVDNINIEKGVLNWKTILTKITTYNKLLIPFNIFDIRQTDDVFSISNKMLSLLKYDKKQFIDKFAICHKKLVSYEEALIKIKQTFEYKNNNNYRKNAISILQRNVDTCIILTNIICSLSKQIKQVTNYIEIINCKDNSIQKQLDTLSIMNHYILDNYHKIISQNTDLDISTLQNKNKCFDYLNSFPLSSNWTKICLGVKNYLYFKNIKKMSLVGEYKAIKCKLKNIIKDENIIKSINDHVQTIDKITTRAYIFIKMYVLNAYEKKESIPDVTDVDFISMAIRAITINDPRGANMNDKSKELLEKLKLFYDSDFKPIFGEKYSAKGLSQMLGFVKIQMTTAYKNNITMNYVKYVNNYMFAVFNEMYKSEFIKLNNKKDKNEFKKELKKQITIGINDIFDGNVCGMFENMKSTDPFKKWIIDNINKVVPKNIDCSKKEIEKELEKNPIVFFEKMIHMNIELEKMQRKMFNCFPLRTNLVPSNIDIDTMSIITLFIKKEKEGERTKGISIMLKNNITILYDKIWGEIVNLKGKEFKWNDKYKFDHHITTDGVDVTILFRHIDICNLDVHIKQSNKDTFKYIDKLGETKNGWDKELMKDELKKMCAMYTLVMIDPGKNPDLLYMCNYDDNVKKVKYFKYTTKQRLHEIGTIKHRKILQKFKDENKINEIEKKLGEVSSKTCIFKQFIIYTKNKNEVDEILREHYNLPFIRKLRVRSYINKLRSESKLVNNIESKFKNNNKEIVLIYGDWSRLNQMRGVISTPCIGLKRRLAENFKIFNIDEFRTSCLDNITLKKNKNASVYNKKSGKKKELHSVLVSNILGNADSRPLKRFQNRNRNSSLNMRNIIENYKNNGERKLEFSRSYKLNINNDENENPNFGLPKLGQALTLTKVVSDQTLRYLNVIPPKMLLQYSK
jgi:hypothetical protein